MRGAAASSTQSVKDEGGGGAAHFSRQVAQPEGEGILQIGRGHMAPPGGLKHYSPDAGEEKGQITRVEIFREKLGREFTILLGFSCK